MSDMNITAQRGHVQALAFARKGGKAMSDMLHTIAHAKSIERMGPLQSALFLELNFTDEEVESVPVPGSKQGETGNKPYDRYTSEVTTKDGKRKVPGSWFTDAVKATEAWEHYDFRIVCCDDITTDGCPDDIRQMGTGERALEKKRCRQAISDMRTALTKGAMLFHHVGEIAQLNEDKIRVKMPYKVFKVVKDGEATDETETKVIGSLIRLQDPSGEKEDVVFTVSEFLALDPSKIPANTEATISALELTKARAPRGGGKAGKGGQANVVPPTTVEGFLTMCNVLATSIDVEDDKGRNFNTKLLAACAQPGEKGEDTIETIGDFALAIDNIWTNISDKYHEIKAKRLAAANAKAAAERQAKKTA